MKIRSLPDLLVLLVVAFAAGNAIAQTQITTGVIRGSIADPAGAVIPGAAIKVRNVDTNLIR